MEEWRDIEGYVGQYQVSSLGRVKSLAREIKAPNGGTRSLPECIMVQHLHFRGYMTVWLRRPKEHRKFFVHTLVAKAFHPNPNKLPVVNHMKGDKTDNRASELEWASYSENTQHYYRGRERAEANNEAF